MKTVIGCASTRRKVIARIYTQHLVNSVLISAIWNDKNAKASARRVQKIPMDWSVWNVLNGATTANGNAQRTDVDQSAQTLTLATTVMISANWNAKNAKANAQHVTKILTD
jgi:alpha-D-ribose 1-methylphosphonate 5-triphosphate synthase subunit PhnL